MGMSTRVCRVVFKQFEARGGQRLFQFGDLDGVRIAFILSVE